MSDHVTVIYKQSQLQVVRGVYRRFTGEQRRWLRRRWQASHDAHVRTLAAVVRVLRRAGVRSSVLGRAALRAIPPSSLVISVGGDGTFLHTAHLLTETPLLGVNSDPQHSRGVFCCCTAATFARTWEWWLRGRLPVIPLHRLAVEVNGRRLREPVLNDVLVTHRNPGATMRYVLAVGRRIEEQMSSGVWIATAAGSTGAVLSAGGRAVPLVSRRVQFVVREPYPKDRARYRLTRGFVPSGGRVAMTALVPGGALYLDGPSVHYPLRFADRCVVRDAGLPLRAVGVKRAVPVSAIASGGRHKVE